MKNKVIIPHQKGNCYVGKTKWSKVRKQQNNPIIDEENPELACESGKIFTKPRKKKNR